MWLYIPHYGFDLNKPVMMVKMTISDYNETCLFEIYLMRIFVIRVSEMD